MCTRASWFNLVRRRAFRRELEANFADGRALVALFDPPLAERLLEPVAGIPMIDRRRIEICRALISRPQAPAPRRAVRRHDARGDRAS